MILTIRQRFLLCLTLLAALAAGRAAEAAPGPSAPSHILKTRRARLRIDEKGFITSLVSLKSGKVPP